MPKVPGPIEPSLSLDVPRAPLGNIEIATRPGRALQKAGEALTAFSKELRQRQRDVDIIEAKIEMRRRIDEIAVEVAKDPATAPQRYDELTGAAHAEVLSKISDRQTALAINLEGRGQIANSRGPMLRTTAVAMQKISVEALAADIQHETSVGASGSEVDFARAGGKLDAIIKHAVDMNVISEPTAKLMRQEQRANLEIERVRFHIGEEDFPAARVAMDHAKFLNEAQQNQLLDEVEQEERELNTRHRGITARDTAKQISDLEIAIAEGSAGRKEIAELFDKTDLFDEPMMTAAKRTQLTKMVIAREKGAKNDTINLERVAAALDGTGLPLDFKDGDDKKAVDAYYNLVIEPATADLDLNDKMNVIVQYSTRVGIIPKTIQGEIRGVLRAGTPEQKVIYADMLDRFASSNPGLLQDFSAKDIALGKMIAGAQRAGVGVEQAVKYAEDAIFAPSEAERKVREAAIVSERHTTANRSKLKGELQGWIKVFDPDLPDALVGEYDFLSKMHYRATGDLEVAQEMALAEIGRVWSVTKVSGDDRWMKYAPEAIYGNAAGVDWIKEQFGDALVATGFAVKKEPPRGSLDPRALGLDLDVERLSDFHIEVDPQSVVEIDPATNQLAPRYLISQKLPTGEFVELRTDEGTPVYWKPDFKLSAERERMVKQVKKDTDKARKKRADEPGRKEAMRQIFGQQEKDMREVPELSETEGAKNVKRTALSANLKRGLRNKNPLNIRLVGKNKWRGRVSPGRNTDGVFEQFKDNFHGLRAGAKLVMNHQSRRGISSIMDLAAVWAPPNENDTVAWAGIIAKRTGFDVNEKLDFSSLPILSEIIAAMVFAENGEQPFSEEQLKDALRAAGAR